MSWPCEKEPRPRCKCGIYARRGVVPSELGYGWYCGNSYGDYWEGRTCDWETFDGMKRMRRGLALQAEPLKTRTTVEIKNEIRDKYSIPIPAHKHLFGVVCKDYLAKYPRVEGQKPNFFVREDLIRFWRQNREKYSFPMSEEDQLKEAEEDEARRREDMRRAFAEFDPLKVFPPGSKEYNQQWYVAVQRGINLKEVRLKAKEAQLEAMKALVADLPQNMAKCIDDKVAMEHIEEISKGAWYFGNEVDDMVQGDKGAWYFGNEVDDMVEGDKGAWYFGNEVDDMVEGDKEMAKEAQVEAMKAVVHDLPKGLSKDKGVIVISSDSDDDSWGELIPGCESD